MHRVLGDEKAPKLKLLLNLLEKINGDYYDDIIKDYYKLELFFDGNNLKVKTNLCDLEKLIAKYPLIWKKVLKKCGKNDFSNQVIRIRYINFIKEELLEKAEDLAIKIFKNYHKKWWE
jgi:hypothetical protein